MVVMMMTLVMMVMMIVRVEQRPGKLGKQLILPYFAIFWCHFGALCWCPLLTQGYQIPNYIHFDKLHVVHCIHSE